MVLRGFFLIACAFGLALCLFSLDAASAARSALDVAHVAQGQTDPARSRALLTTAEHELDGAWSRPLAWNADALEARSWIAALQADGGGADARVQSGQFAAASVRRGPLNAYPWLRLATIPNNGVCAPKDCLENSWFAASALRFEDACSRLLLSHEVGGLSETSARVSAVARGVYYGRTAILDCVRFASPETKFQLLLDAKARSLSSDQH